MWPWGHLAVGYLLYSAIERVQETRPDGREPIAVAFRALLPDLIDKPLAWTVGVLPTGRSLGHSLLFAIPLLAVLVVVLDRPTAFAFGVGYLSHLFADVGPGLLSGSFADATYLVWPLLPSPDYALDQSFIAHLRAFSFSPYELIQFALFGVALGVWVLNGRPGLAVFRE